jgi:hypothetical protein
VEILILTVKNRTRLTRNTHAQTRLRRRISCVCLAERPGAGARCIVSGALFAVMGLLIIGVL